MATTFHACKCPSCGAELQYEEGRKQMFCEFCGTKILIENDNEFIYREVNEAEIERAKADRDIEDIKARHEKEMWKLEYDKDQKETKQMVIAAIIFLGFIASFWAILLAVIPH